jgi:hypothetical protein
MNSNNDFVGAMNESKSLADQALEKILKESKRLADEEEKKREADPVSSSMSAYSFAFLTTTKDYSKYEFSNKIIIPQHLHNHILGLRKIPTPWVFKLENKITGKTCYCTLLEASEDENAFDLYVPNRIVENLFMEQGQELELTLLPYKIPSGEKIVLQAHTSDFLELEDHKTVLENALSDNYNVITSNEVIRIEHGSKTFDITVTATEPSDEILTNNADIVVDFKPPLDYKEPPPPPPKPEPIIKPSTRPVSGHGGMISHVNKLKKSNRNGKTMIVNGQIIEPGEEIPVTKPNVLRPLPTLTVPPLPQPKGEEKKEEETFTGSGNKLGGHRHSIYNRDWSRLGLSNDTLKKKAEKEIIPQLNDSDDEDTLDI